MKRRILLLVALLPLALLALFAGRELLWRMAHPLVQPAAHAADAAYLAEVRRLPDSVLLAPGSWGVFVQTRTQWLRSVQPQLVFVGACDHVDTRWLARRRLLIECQLRAGEPRLLRALVDDVVIELVIQPQFGLARPPRLAALTRR